MSFTQEDTVDLHGVSRFL